MSFSDLKRNRGKDLEKLTKEVEKLTGGGEKSQEFYYPVRDKAGNASVVLRFMPAPHGEDVPFVRLFNHGFRGPTGKWYIENSLTTIGKDDPLGKYNSELWNASQDDESPQRKQARAQKRKLNYIANVMIIKDTASPELEGTVIPFKFGKRIFDKLNDLMNPEFDDESPVNPFDFWEGANFRLVIRKVDGQTNYDKSKFDDPSALSEDDDYLEGVYNKLPSLQKYIAPDQFKSYEELEKRMNEVLGLDGDKTETKTRRRNDDEELPELKEPVRKTREAPKQEVTEESNDEDEDSLSFFRSLAEDSDD